MGLIRYDFVILLTQLKQHKFHLYRPQLIRVPYRA
jgi:hypothetical protein